MTDESNDIERYRKNQMTDAERHALEKKALSDPFLADALEGAEGIPPEDFRQDVTSLNEKVRQKSSQSIVFAVRIAAGIALVLTVGWLIFREGAPAEPVELASTSTDSTAAGGADTVRPQLSLTKPGTYPTEAQGRARQEAKAPAPAATQPADATETAVTATAEKIEAEETVADVTVAEAKEVEATKDDQPAKNLRASDDRKKEAAPRMISGKVTEAEDGLPLPGAVVRDQASNQETRAAADGSYSLRVTADKPNLQYSYPGLQTLEKSVSGPSSNAQLRDNPAERSEVIVLGDPDAREGAAGGALITAAPTGGLEAYRLYLEKNQRVPEQARTANVHGKVTISFLVDENGTLKDFLVVKGLCSGCDEELIRLVKEGPSWSPSRTGSRTMPALVWVKLDF